MRRSHAQFRGSMLSVHGILLLLVIHLTFLVVMTSSSEAVNHGDVTKLKRSASGAAMSSAEADPANDGQSRNRPRGRNRPRVHGGQPRVDEDLPVKYECYSIIYCRSLIELAILTPCDRVMWSRDASTLCCKIFSTVWYSWEEVGVWLMRILYDTISGEWPHCCCCCCCILGCIQSTSDTIMQSRAVIVFYIEWVMDSSVLVLNSIVGIVYLHMH